MTAVLEYVFDPLCGWCYGASAALSRLVADGAVQVRLHPCGLFSEDGARPMDDEFADFAWANDQRIAKLTGSPFTQAYRTQVLGSRDQRFDSGPATLALTAVALTAPEREVEALGAIQRARFVEGRDITKVETLAELLAGCGLSAAASLLQAPVASLHSANRRRIDEAQELMRAAGAHGVPTFLLHQPDGRLRLLPAGAAYSNPRAFAAQFLPRNEMGLTP